MLGTNPTIPTNATVNDNVPMQYDFRSIYSTILQNWFCLDKTVVDGLFPPNINAQLQNLPLIKTGACSNTPPPPVSTTDKVIWNSPAPYSNSTTIYFKTQGGHTLLQIFDTLGRQITTLVDKDYPAAMQDKVSFNAERLPTGIYYARLQNGINQTVWPMLKVRE